MEGQWGCEKNQKFFHSPWWRGSKLPRHCHPYQFPLKSCGFSGAETARKRFLLWKMGFSDAKIAPSPPYTPPGTIKTRKGFGSTIRNSRLAALPLARLLPLSSAWSLRIVRKLTRGAPCFTGLIGGYCSHRLRRLFRPHWTSASPVSATGGGEAPSLSRSPLGFLTV